jgi:hypothetical protein
MSGQIVHFGRNLALVIIAVIADFCPDAKAGQWTNCPLTLHDSFFCW